MAYDWTAEGVVYTHHGIASARKWNLWKTTYYFSVYGTVEGQPSIIQGWADLRTVDCLFSAQPMMYMRNVRIEQHIYPRRR